MPGQAVRASTPKRGDPKISATGRLRPASPAWLFIIKGMFVATATVATIASFVIPDLSGVIRAAILTYSAIAAVVVVLPQPARVRFVAGALLVVTATCALFAINRIVRPNEAEKIIDIYFAQTRDAGIWSGTAQMFPPSRDYMIRHFAAFDPRSWHGPDLYAESVAVTVKELATSGGEYQGQAVWS